MSIVKIIAHRGASRYTPENTIAAFNKAIDLKADAIELDVRLSKDGVPVIIHDKNINRTSNGKGTVSDMTVKEMKKYSFGVNFHPSFVDETIPTYEEFLQLVTDHPITIHLEIKSDPNKQNILIQKILELSKAYSVEDRIVYSSFDHQLLQQLKVIHPGVKIALLCKKCKNIFTYIDQLDYPIYSIHPKHVHITEEIVKKAADRNIVVNIYTVNQVKSAHKYRAMGIDGLFTDDPLIFQQNNPSS